MPLAFSEVPIWNWCEFLAKPKKLFNKTKRRVRSHSETPVHDCTTYPLEPQNAVHSTDNAYSTFDVWFLRVLTAGLFSANNAGCRVPSVAGVTAAVPAPSVVAERTAAAVEDAFPHGKTDARTVRHHPNQHRTRPNGPSCHRTVRESVIRQLPARSTCV